MIPTVYKIEFPDGSCYIGSTVNFQERRRTHLRHGARGEAVNKKLAEKFKKYPVCGIYQVATATSREKLHLVEQQVMFDVQPDLNVHISPDPLPAYYDGAAKPLGPHPSVRVAAHVLGVTYHDMKRWARRCNYDYPKILESLAKITTPTKPQGTHPLDPRKQSALVNLGSGWERRSDILAAHSVTPSMYEDRRESGWSVEAAMTTPPKGAFVGPHKPRMYSEYREVAAGVPAYLYKSRIKAGWTEAQALGLEIRKVQPNVKKRHITIDAITKTLDQWCAGMGLTKSQVYGRLSLGWTEREALGFDTPKHIAKRADAKALEKSKRDAKLLTIGRYTGRPAALAREFGMTDYEFKVARAAGFGTPDYEVPRADVNWGLIDITFIRYTLDEFV